jgi:hypothetical protein
MPSGSRSRRGESFLIRLLAIRTGLLSGPEAAANLAANPAVASAVLVADRWAGEPGTGRSYGRTSRLRALGWRGALALKQALPASATETNRTRLSAALRQVGQTLDPATGRSVLGPLLGQVLLRERGGPAARPASGRPREQGEKISDRLVRLRVPDGLGEASRSRCGPARPTGSAGPLGRGKLLERARQGDLQNYSRLG